MKHGFTRTDILLSVLLLVALIVTIVLAVLILDEEDEKDTHIEVEEVYFVVEAQSGARTRIKIILFVSNTGEDDISSLSVRAFPVETDSNLAQGDASVEVRDVKGKTTAEGNLTIEVPNRDYYRVEILVFRDGKLDLRGSGTIDLTDVGIATDYRTYPDDAGGAEYAPLTSAKDASGLSILCMMAFIAAGIVGLIIFIRIASKKTPQQVAGEVAIRKELGIPPEVVEGQEDGPANEMIPLDAYLDHEEDGK